MMPASKIHCGYYEVFGPNWNSASGEKAQKIISTLDGLELLGEEPNMFGFVGTGKCESAIGGFLAIQYPAELRQYDKQKHLNLRNDKLFERVFFILFAKTGKLILQHKKFTDIPISFDLVSNLIKDALTEVFSRAKFGYVLSINSPEENINGKETFETVFRSSERVERLRISSPNPNEIPTDINYYNPNFEKNPIIRESHQHDYPNFETVDLEASEQGNLKNTHLAKDLIHAGTPLLMKYSTNNEYRVLKRVIPTKFELYVDVNSEFITTDTLISIIEMLEREYGLPIHVPVQENRLGQISLFGYPDNEENTDE